MNDSALRGLMACLGDASRFRLVRVLKGGARCVSDLAVEVGLSQSCTTRHLQALERRGVVSGSRDGKRVLYQLRYDDRELIPLLALALDPGDGGASDRAVAGGRHARSRPRPPATMGGKASQAAVVPGTELMPPTERPDGYRVGEDARPVADSSPGREGPPAEPSPPRAPRQVLEDYLL